jgi:hypothetical protein
MVENYPFRAIVNTSITPHQNRTITQIANIHAGLMKSNVRIMAHQRAPKSKTN